MVNFPISRAEYEKKRGSQNRFQIFFCKLCGLLIQIVFNNEFRVSLCKSMGVTIGKNVFLGKYCIIDDNYSELISIEDDVVISFGVTIITHDYSKDIVAPVTIKRGFFRITFGYSSRRHNWRKVNCRCGSSCNQRCAC